MLRKLIAALCLSALLACPADAVTGTRRVLLSGHVALWSPLNAPNLVAWWDTQFLPNIVFNGSKVSSITDRSPNAVVASQATAANQPVWSASARNGKAGMTFNGSSTFLQFSAAIFPSGSAPGSYFCAAESTSTAGFCLLYGTGSSLNWRAVDAQTSNVMAGLFAGDISTSTAWLNNDRFVEYLVGSASQQLFIDGISAGSSSFVPNTIGTTGFIGTQISPGFFAGPIQQIVVLGAVPSTCLQQKLEGWESWYDGKNGSNLPSNHPYKTSAPAVGGAC